MDKLTHSPPTTANRTLINSDSGSNLANVGGRGKMTITAGASTT